MPVTLIDTLSRFRSDQRARLKGVATFLLNRNNIAGHNVNIVLTNDKEISQFNKQFRKQNGPTNVLSFPFEADVDPPGNVPYPDRELGDIIISVETAEKEAHRYNQTVYYRLAWLMTHGILHLLGYDHERSEADANEMYELEVLLLDELQKQRRMKMTHLTVNLNYLAALRQKKVLNDPDPITAAAICELSGARGISVHLREDRQPIKERDAKLLRETVKTKLNLEMGTSKEIVKFAVDLHPDLAKLVPEKRQDFTINGGLDLLSQKKKIGRTIEKLRKENIPSSLFIDPDPEIVKISHELGASFVEFNTLPYAKSHDRVLQHAEFSLIESASEEAWQLGMQVSAGHGLNYSNATPIASLDTIDELSVGHAIISRAVFSGLEQAVRDMETIIRNSNIS